MVRKGAWHNELATPIENSKACAGETRKWKFDQRHFLGGVNPRSRAYIGAQILRLGADESKRDPSLLRSSG
jgi:hypothetical protein